MDYRSVDCFSGAGGLALGLIKAGFNLQLSFDSDDRCIETQKLNSQYFSHESCIADITDMLSGRLLRRIGLKKGELFLLAGGPPCQGFSIQRIGNDQDTRNNLVLQFMDLVEEVIPYYFLIENVPGIKGNRGRELLYFLFEKGRELGYEPYYTTLDAQYYGVPQRRRRVFVVGERLDGMLPSFSFPVPTRTRKNVVTVRQAIGHLPPPPDDGTEHPNILHHRKDRLSYTNKERLRALKPGQGRDHLPYHLLAECHRVASSVIGHRNVYGRMKWDDVAPTLTARFDSFTRGMFGHPEQFRSISLREGAILQTFPDDFIFAGNKVEIARQIGNAVPILLAQAIGTQILKCYEAKMVMRSLL